MIQIKENLILNSKYPGNLKYNRQIFEKYKDYFDSVSEMLYCYKYNIIERPKCKKCGKELKFILNKGSYRDYCSTKCLTNSNEIREKIKQTTINRYGVAHYNKSQDFKQRQNEIQNKYKQTMLEKYGETSNFKLKEYKEFMKEHQKEFQDKSKQTCLKKYGVDYYNKTQECKDRFKQIMISKYGETTNLKTQEFKDYMKEHNDEFQKKAYNTKKKNNTFNKSKGEEQVYTELLKKFNKEDIYRQYKSEQYPYACDFYIKSLDLYIECNFSQYHNHKPFVNSIEDNKELKRLKLKSEEINSKGKKKKQYLNVINTWSKRDPLKLKTFKENNLNYEIFYTLEEFNKWYNNI